MDARTLYKAYLCQYSDLVTVGKKGVIKGKVGYFSFNILKQPIIIINIKVIITPIRIVATNPEIVFEPNPYYDASYNGDPNYLEDKFVRFGYRFNYVDGENSIFSPFTQPTFIPKQDGRVTLYRWRSSVASRFTR